MIKEKIVGGKGKSRVRYSRKAEERRAVIDPYQGAVKWIAWDRTRSAEYSHEIWMTHLFEPFAQPFDNFVSPSWGCSCPFQSSAGFELD